MKKVLLGTSALVAAGLIAGPAAAQLELGITGDVYMELGWVSEDDDDGTDRDYGSRTDANLRFNAAGTAENGLRYGGRIDIEGLEGGDGDDGGEAWVTVSGGFGTIVGGEEDGASSLLRITPPGAGTGILDGSYSGYVGGGSVLDFDTADTGDANKIVYTTDGTALDNFGLTLGASWAPAAEGRGSARSQAERTQGVGDGPDNVISLGARYSGNFGAASFGVSAGYVTGDGAPGAEDHSAYQVGAEVGFGAFTVGGMWVDNDDSVVAGGDDTSLIFGASFSQGPWDFAAQVGFGEEADTDETSFGVGATYQVAPGLTAHADVVIFDNDDNDGFVGIGRLKAAF